MTDPELENALQSAFPTEPVPEPLRQRVENLTPLAPVVTRPRLKFRHVFAVFAFLWIGHNIPVAIKDWNSYSQSQYHRRYWSTDSEGKLRLSMEEWHKGGNTKIRLLPSKSRPEETISLFKPDANYKYNITKRTLTIEKLKYNYRKELLRYQLDRALALCLFRVKDTRPTVLKDGKPQIAPAYWASPSSFSDPEPEVRVSYTKQHNNNYKEEFERGTDIPDSVFEARFPDDVQRTNLPDRVIPPTGWFSDFLMQANRYIWDAHP